MADSEEKNGRPSKYRPEFCQDLIDHSKTGGSVESFPAYLSEKYADMRGHNNGVHHDTVRNWAGAHEEFLAALKQAGAHAMRHFEQLGAAGMTGQLRRVSKETFDAQGNVVHREYEQATFNAAVYIFTMKNRFKWREHTNLTFGKDEHEPQTIAELARELYRENTEQEQTESIGQIPERLSLPHRIIPGGKDVTPQADRIVQPPIET